MPRTGMIWFSIYLLVNVTVSTDFMQHSFSCGTNSRSTTLVPHFVKQNFINVFIRAHPTTLSWSAWFLSTPYSCSFMIHFNNIHLYTPVSSEEFLPLRFSKHMLYPVLVYPVCLPCLACIIKNVTTWQYLMKNTNYESCFAVASNLL
jgi:hypothetical protein